MCGFSFLAHNEMEQKQCVATLPLSGQVTHTSQDNELIIYILNPLVVPRIQLPGSILKKNSLKILSNNQFVKYNLAFEGYTSVGLT